MSPELHNARVRCKALLQAGVPLGDAERMSGLDRIRKETRKRRVTILVVVYAVIMTFVVMVAAAATLWFSIKPAFAEDTRVESAIQNEAWFAACLNGVTIRVGDTLFHCLPAGRAKIVGRKRP